MQPLHSHFLQQLYLFSLSSYFFMELTITCIQVERVLSFWRDGHITLESTAKDKKGKGGIQKAINEQTGKETKTTDFNHVNWRVATNAYLASIKANIANGKLVWKELINAAMEFAKMGVKLDENLTAGDVEDERALLVADSDSESAAGSGSDQN
jgi:hypothetical protein